MLLTCLSTLSFIIECYYPLDAFFSDQPQGGSVLPHPNGLQLHESVLVQAARLGTGFAAGLGDLVLFPWGQLPEHVVEGLRDVPV